MQKWLKNLIVVISSILGLDILLNLVYKQGCHISGLECYIQSINVYYAFVAGLGGSLAYILIKGKDKWMKVLGYILIPITAIILIVSYIAIAFSGGWGI